MMKVKMCGCLSSYGETQTENSVISAQSGESIFYFDSVSEAFDAAGSDLTGDLTFALLKDAEYEKCGRKSRGFFRSGKRDAGSERTQPDCFKYDSFFL